MLLLSFDEYCGKIFKESASFVNQKKVFVFHD